jgi:cysteine-S-conjugate beta-lyase
MTWNKAIERTNTGSFKWEAMAKQGINASTGIFPFSVADNDLPLAEALREGLVEHLNTAVLGYTGMTLAYQEAVIHWMANHHQWAIEPGWILTSPGVVTALYRCVRAFTNVGEGVVIQPPVYPPFFSAIRESGRRVIQNPLRNNQGVYTMDLADLESKLSDPQTTMMILCSPHNPVGRVWTTEELDDVLTLCQRYGVTLISDEIHFDLIRPGFHHTVAANRPIAKTLPVVTLTAPSKTFNIAGLQCANVIIADPDLRQRLMAEGAKDGFHGINALGLKACELAYTRCESWLVDFLALIDANHQTLVSFLKEHGLPIKATPLEGTYLQWLDFSALGLTDVQLHTFLVQHAQLVLTPGIDFGVEGQGYMRLNLGCDPAVLCEGLWRLKQALEIRSIPSTEVTKQ